MSRHGGTRRIAGIAGDPAADSRPALLALVTATVLAGTLAAGCRPAGDDERQIVELERAWLDDGPPLYGITNLFFEPVDRIPALEIATMPDAEGLEADALYGRETPRPVWVARYSEPDGAFTYVVDTDADLDFAEERALDFRELPRGTRLADLRLAVDALRPTGPGPGADSIDYQVATTDDGWVYGRVHEYRRGRIEVDGRPVEIVLQPRSRNHPFYGPDDETRLFIDLNGDGRVDRSASVTRDGRRVSSEEASAHLPFRIGARALVVAELDSLGRRLVVAPSETDVAAAVGFAAPELAGRDPNGRERSLAALRRDTVVVLEFWSIACAFCEAARPRLNEMARSLSGRSFSWVIVPYERDAAEVMAFLADHPTEARVLFADSAVWSRYNPEMITPRFFVVDEEGMIRFEARGSGDAVEALVDAVDRMTRE